MSLVWWSLGKKQTPAGTRLVWPEERRLNACPSCAFKFTALKVASWCRLASCNVPNPSQTVEITRRDGNKVQASAYGRPSVKPPNAHLKGQLLEPSRIARDAADWFGAQTESWTSIECQRPNSNSVVWSIKQTHFLCLNSESVYVCKLINLLAISCSLPIMLAHIYTHKNWS